MPRHKQLAFAYLVAIFLYGILAYSLIGMYFSLLAGFPGWLRMTFGLLIIAPPFLLAAKALAAWNNEPN